MKLTCLTDLLLLLLLLLPLGALPQIHHRLLLGGWAYRHDPLGMPLLLFGSTALQNLQSDQQADSR
jgi:hypothetical protein